MSKELIASTIKSLPDLDDETLIYYYKCSIGKDASYKPLIKAIETERRARNKIQIITEDPDDTATSAEL